MSTLDELKLRIRQLDGELNMLSRTAKDDLSVIRLCKLFVEMDLLNDSIISYEKMKLITSQFSELNLSNVNDEDSMVAKK